MAFVTKSGWMEEMLTCDLKNSSGEEGMMGNVRLERTEMEGRNE